VADARIEHGVSTRLLVVLAILAAAAPLSVDFYLPSFPQVLRELHTDAPSLSRCRLRGALRGCTSRTSAGCSGVPVSRVTRRRSRSRSG